MINKDQSPILKEKRARGGTYRKANIALGLSALGLFSAYPFQGTTWGGLLTSGCSAALVGGLADWFAVNALFRRPLGVPAGKVFRTEIIPRNRERIFQALRSMVENELLSHEVLKTKVETYDFSAPATAIWNTLDRDSFQSILTQCLQQIQENLDDSIKELHKESLALLKQKSIREEHFIPLAEKAFRNVLESQEGKRAVAILLDNLSCWVQETEIHLLLTHWLEKSIDRYISKNPSRKIFGLFLPDPSKLAHSLQKQVADYLLEDQTHAEVLEWLKLRVKEETWVISVVYPKLIESLTTGLMQKLHTPESALSLSEQLLQSLDEGVLSLNEDPEKRHRFNRYVQGLVVPFLDNKHEKIGEIVHEGLEKYSNEMLVELIESKAGDDLQMIRINGSVVGGLAGMVIYLVSQFLV
ncbi:MAG TPA: DUF445 domain-containing protein [Desulfitobacterium dehalogenans]|uniref:DUF445 domain-containing protein n=1 Tax=Desulfitobacterium dehalogenans TaxID=36854 RepID=A0A7C6Z431_9FIRM|nr:DUF445 domain-containing protein [Desulfitobacterium dehalogenans]